MRHARAIALFLGCMPTLAPALECSVNVLTAYQVAVKRGWRFDCGGAVGVQRGFVTYPPNAIGCTFKTGPLVPPPVPGAGNAMVLLFQGQSSSHLKNGWSLKAYEMTGGQFKPTGTSDTLVAAYITLGKPNRTYNYKLTKLVISKPGSGTCSQAIEQAF
jgi:hypothetical protein